MTCRQRASATLLYEVFTGEVAADAVVRMERKRSPGHAGPDFADAQSELPEHSVYLLRILRSQRWAITRSASTSGRSRSPCRCRSANSGTFIGLIDASEVLYLPRERAPVK